MNLSHSTRTLVAIALIGFSLNTHAGDYKVEMVVFENNNSSVATENNDYVAPKRMNSGSKAWFLEPTLLLEEAKKISDSDKYQLKHHYAWGVESLPYRNSANYTIIESDIKGYVKVYADQLLFTNIDLDFNGFRMDEKRRLKLNEKHFFDHPKFGIIMQVSRLIEPVEETEIETVLDKTPDPTLKLETSR